MDAPDTRPAKGEEVKGISPPDQERLETTEDREKHRLRDDEGRPLPGRILAARRRWRSGIAFRDAVGARVLRGSAARGDPGAGVPRRPRRRQRPLYGVDHQRDGDHKGDPALLDVPGDLRHGDGHTNVLAAGRPAHRLLGPGGRLGGRLRAAAEDKPHRLPGAVHRRREDGLDPGLREYYRRDHRYGGSTRVVADDHVAQFRLQGTLRSPHAFLCCRALPYRLARRPRLSGYRYDPPLRPRQRAPADARQPAAGGAARGLVVVADAEPAR